MVHCTALVEHHGPLVLHCVTRLAPIGCPLVPVVRWWQVGLTAPFSAQCPHREVNKGGKTHDTQWTTFENFVAGGNTVVVANGKLTRKIYSDSQQGKKCDAGTCTHVHGLANCAVQCTCVHVQCTRVHVYIVRVLGLATVGAVNRIIKAVCFWQCTGAESVKYSIHSAK